jgi:LmbE family N-acetylglucosaminyl deacetylase
MLELLRNKRVMIVVAHPDDELLGLGATMNRLIQEFNVLTHVLILGEGITSRSDSRNLEKWEKELSTHRKNIESAQRAIGYHSIVAYSFPDNRFDSIPLLDIIKVIEKEKLSFCPDVIFTHHGGDLNIDHQRTFDSVITACRPMAGENVKAIITFETPSGTEWRASSDPRHFIPNMFCCISKSNMQSKITAMECYEFERRNFPHPRSPEALMIQAQRWGVAIGAELAEAFCIVRVIGI